LLIIIAVSALLLSLIEVNSMQTITNMSYTINTIFFVENSDCSSHWSKPFL